MAGQAVDRVAEELQLTGVLGQPAGLLSGGQRRAGVPDPEVPRVERMFSTLVLGYAASEVGGRFGPGELDPRGRRGQLPEGALPAHARLEKWLDAPVNWSAEFEADIEDLLRLVESIARKPRARKG